MKYLNLIGTLALLSYLNNASAGETSTEQRILMISLNSSCAPKFIPKRCLTLGYNIDFLHASDNLHHNALGTDENGSTAWGIALYAKHQFNSLFSLATRGEYLHSNDGTLGFVDALVPTGNSASTDSNNVFVSNTDLWSWTLTAGFDIVENLLLRLEYRLDVASSDGGTNGENNIFGNNQSTQHTFAINAAYLFW